MRAGGPLLQWRGLHQQEPRTHPEQGAELEAHFPLSRTAHPFPSHVVRKVGPGVALRHASLSVEPDPRLPRLRPAGRAGVLVRAAAQSAAGARVRGHHAPDPHPLLPEEAHQTGLKGGEHHIPRAATQSGRLPCPSHGRESYWLVGASLSASARLLDGRREPAFAIMMRIRGWPLYLRLCCVLLWPCC